MNIKKGIFSLLVLLSIPAHAFKFTVTLFSRGLFYFN